MKKMFLLLIVALVFISGCDITPEKEPGYEVRAPLHEF